MTEEVHVYIAQGPKDIIYQLETNLCDAREIRRPQEAAQQWKERVKNRDFSSLVAIVNREMDPLLAEELTSEDFEDAEVYPNADKMMEHELKHGLPALSFGVAIPKERWSSIQRKFRMRETSQGISLSDYGFSEQSLGLDATGLTMHTAAEEKEYEEFQQLYEDHAAYSRSMRDLAPLTLRKLRSPWELSMALLCRTTRDLSAWRYEAEGKSAQENNLRRMLEVYGNSYKAELVRRNGEPGDLAAFAEYYQTTVKPIADDIPRAIEAVYALEERVGPAIVTPLLFALGIIKQETGRHAYYSPLHAIIKAREYFESGELRVEDVTQILGKKGYNRMVFT